MALYKFCIIIIIIIITTTTTTILLRICSGNEFRAARPTCEKAARCPNLVREWQQRLVFSDGEFNVVALLVCVCVKGSAALRTRASFICADVSSWRQTWSSQ